MVDAVSSEILDMYAETRPTIVESILSDVRSIETALQNVASTRQYLAEQSGKCDAAESALTARLNALRDAVVKLEKEYALAV